MRWSAHFPGDERIDNDDLIYHDIKDRLDDLVRLSAQIGRKRYSVLWNTGDFRIVQNIHDTEEVPTIVEVFDITTLTNVRPIAFRRERVNVNVHNAELDRPFLESVGLGFQGNLPNGKNKQVFLLIRPNGSYVVKVK